MQALFYEHFLCMIYQCGRTLRNGADADIYRSMEHAHFDLTIKSMYRTDQEREYEFRKRFTEVRGNIRAAILQGLRQCLPSAEDIAKLNGMLSTISDIAFYDKDKLDEIIKEAWDIFKAQQVFV